MNRESRQYGNLLERSEHYIYLVAGYILVIAAAGLLVAAVFEVAITIIAGEYTAAIIHLLDRVLLSLMLAEIIYTVGRVVQTQQLETEPFLVVGIIAAIRRLLIITAEGASHVDIADPRFLGTLAELGLLAAIILMLAWAMRLLRNATVNAPDKEPSVTGDGRDMP
jgi:uncharacterized membrane protein (DUF373 family)